MQSANNVSKMKWPVKTCQPNETESSSTFSNPSPQPQKKQCQRYLLEN